MRFNPRLTVAVITALGVGCSHNVIRSDHVEACYKSKPTAGDPCDHSVPTGLAYSLPKGQVLLAAFRKPITAAEVAKAAADYASAQKAITDASAKVQDALKNQAKNAAAKGATDAQKAQDKAAVDAAQANVTAAKALADASRQNFDLIQSGAPNTPAQLKAAERDLTHAREKLAADRKAKKAQTELEQDQENVDDKTQALADLKASTPKYTETFALTPQAIVPDATKRYVANLDHSHWRDDTLKLSAVNGLLTSTNTTSTDQTANIISSLASAAVGLITFLGAGIPVVPGPPAAAKPQDEILQHKPAPDCSYSFVRVFDPANPDEVDAVNSLLHDARVQAHLEVTSTLGSRNAELTQHPIEHVYPPGTPPVSGTSPKDPPDPRRIDGLVYRTPAGVSVAVLPYEDAATLGNCPLQTPVQAQALQMFVPDTSAEFIAPVEAGAMTASGFQFNFTGGMLADYNLTRPSEVAAGAAIPVDIINKIMTIPTSILKLRLDYATSETNLAKQNAELVSAQGSEAIALVKAKTDLETAETNLTTAEINDPISRLKALTSLVQARQALADAITAAAKSSSAATTPASKP